MATLFALQITANKKKKKFIEEKNTSSTQNIEFSYYCCYGLIVALSFFISQLARIYEK